MSADVPGGGRGRRTDIRDAALAASVDPYYRVGRVLAACEVAHLHAYRRSGGDGAANKLMGPGGALGYLPRGLFSRMQYEWAQDRDRVPDPIREACQPVVDRWLPELVEIARHGHHPGLTQQAKVIIGWHHQHSALRDALAAAGIEMIA